VFPQSLIFLFQQSLVFLLGNVQVVKHLVLVVRHEHGVGPQFVLFFQKFLYFVLEFFDLLLGLFFPNGGQFRDRPRDTFVAP
jgi:uncharacterized membrane protein